MKLRWISVAWSAVYLLLLLSLATPLIVITTFFLMVPGVLLYTTLSTRAFIAHMAVVWLIAALVFGPLILLQAVIFIIPAIVMGYLYKKRSPAFRIVMSGTGVLLLEFILVLLISTVFFNFNLATAIEDMINAAVAPLQDVADSPMSGGLVWSPELSQQFSSLTVRMVPFTMIVCSLLMAAVAHAVSRPTLASLGHAVPKLAPIRDWKLPRSLIWYYLIGLLIQLFSGGVIQNGFLGTIVLNLMPLLQFLFMVQTASFFFFVAYHRKWNPVFPVLLVVALLFIPPLRIVGILDIAFPLRDMITRPRR
ncbi:DUF2232 domain-containing protein [Paenibacillus macerans]|uniref:DUF2232 domain-containing protein n=1 Tax=Paenibacillus macerans TaxID=44252 RepID=UPI00203F9C37|nr:DUF2232 domain-containing protein [Paenibacillus macerans]MCM3702600.1 YybS family protein [Paenibacillus macerans]